MAKIIRSEAFKNKDALMPQLQLFFSIG